MITDSQILITKLQRPDLPSDFINRKRIIEYLDKNIKKPLTLVSAGAGYGKSTLISSWLQEVPYKNSWYSLDESDNDFRSFLLYFIAAIRKSLTDFGQNIKPYIKTNLQAPDEVLIKNLLIDISCISENFILALDDFHLIRNSKIIQFISDLIKFSPEKFHLVLITRTDPALPLIQLRAKNRITDINIAHLRLTNEEIKLFVNHYVQQGQAESIAELLDEKLDGWITGLRLAMLQLPFNITDEKQIEDILGETNYSEEYFLLEIFKQLDERTKDFLLKTSVLEKFSFDLCDYIMSENGKFNSREIVEKLLKENLFVINLDNEKKYFRYHHLFRTLLYKELRNSNNKQKIYTLHRRAAEWYRVHNMPGDALSHALQLENYDTAISVIIEFTYYLLNTDSWLMLERWLQKIPDNHISIKPELLLAQAWIYLYKGIFWLIPDVIENAHRLFKNKKPDEESAVQIKFFDGVISFWNSEIERSLEIFQYVNRKLPADKTGINSVILYYLAVASQMAGKGEEQKMEIEKVLINANAPDVKARLIGALMLMEIIKGDLYAAEQLAERMNKLSLGNEDIFLLAWSWYILGYISFNQNKLEKAKKYFSDALDKIYFLSANAPMDSFAGLLLTEKALGSNKNVTEIINYMNKFVEEKNNPIFVNFANAIKARLTLSDGDLVRAEKYINVLNQTYISGTIFFWIESPRLTYCRVLIASSESEKWDEALSKLNTLLPFVKKTRNVPRLIDIHILKTIIYNKTGRKEKALENLKSAVRYAQPGNWLRPFVEAGRDINGLLTELQKDCSMNEFMRRIINAVFLDKIESENRSKIKRELSLLGKLERFKITNREYEILELLSQRLSNKDIAARLFISPVTVKRYTIRIYRKLGVNNRREAVKKALEAGFLNEFNPA